MRHVVGGPRGGARAHPRLSQRHRRGAPRPAGASPTYASPTSVKVTGAGTALVEVGASAVVVDLTVTPSSGEQTTGSGALVAWPAEESLPVGSNVPYDLSKAAPDG